MLENVTAALKYAVFLRNVFYILFVRWWQQILESNRSNADYM